MPRPKPQQTSRKEADRVADRIASSSEGVAGFVGEVEPKEAVAPSPLRLERRRTHREPVDGAAVAAFRTRERSCLLAGVTVCDVSATGLGVLSPVEVSVGTRVSLFPHEGRVPTAVGVVVRCEATDRGYRLGVERPPTALAA